MTIKVYGEKYLKISTTHDKKKSEQIGNRRDFSQPHEGKYEKCSLHHICCWKNECFNPKLDNKTKISDLIPAILRNNKWWGSLTTCCIMPASSW